MRGENDVGYVAVLYRLDREDLIDYVNLNRDPNGRGFRELNEKGEGIKQYKLIATK